MMLVRASCLPQRSKAGDDAENLQGPEEAVPTRKRDFSRPGGKHVILGTSLVAQWLRIRLPMQGTRVRALVREDPMCPGATKPVCHNY
ncbi:hypothetical protein J1605_005148 [Eschrichtius robustus]|uniref:Uncharacterized protein n=1 Tax=Eschrichtius robustus TaxID=9764 RepID=A0AB34H802_ESCRO|nr:hypothetical protein J1605_005148 [Eschrichtius robustus]